MPEALRGELSSVHLSSILQLAEAERTSGLLRLAEGCTVAFSRGEITAATAGALSGFPALVTLFFLNQGTFVLELAEPDDRPVLAPLLRAILEGTRIVDEWERLGPMKLGWTGEPGLLHDELAGLGPLLDGRMSLHRAAVQLGLSPALLVDPVLTHYEDGRLIERGAPDEREPWVVAPSTPAPTPPSPSPEAAAPRAAPGEVDGIDELLDAGRNALRSGDHGAAEDCFLRALALRPADPIATQNLRHVRRIRSHGGVPPPMSWQRAR